MPIPELNVSTAFGKPFVIAGVLGVAIYFVWFVVFAHLLLCLTPRRYLLAALSIIATFATLLVFDNMLIFASCFLQIPIFFVMSRIKIFGTRFL